MPSTNANKIKDPEKQTLSSRFSTCSTPPSQSKQDRPSQEVDRDTDHKMSKTQHIFLCCILLLIFTFTVSSAAANGAIKSVSLEERLRFQQLLDSVEPAALHEVLHKHLKDKYQHGVYQEDKTAIEVVHQTKPEEAQSLVELAKRQSGNSTVPTPPQSSTSIVVPTTSQAPVTPSTTPAAPTTAPQPTSQVPTTAAVPPTPTIVPTSTSPRTVETPPETSAATRAPSTLATTQRSTTNAPTTSGPANTPNTPTTSRSVTQQIIYTTTRENGTPTTVTSVTIVPAEQPENTGSATKTNPNASLQTNAGNSRSHFGLTGVLGAIGVVVVGAL